ncbi:DUF2393 family protein [Sulfurospirillum cavolei]|uniref:DUF2393 family protein n=1 Tax=Sulfurospirillum cavolei TaxID=366522 RepID=UPI00076485A7|nr:DUF2393 family protein [Sulfurospirillum cavolei]
MLIDALKISLLTYFRNLGLYDYLAFAWLIVTFLTLIAFAILIAKRSSALSVLIIILSLIFFAVSPFLIHYKLNALLRQNVTEITMVKKLVFSDTLIVEATLQNLSQKPFKRCLIQTSAIKQTSAEGIKAWMTRLKPIANQSILVQESLSPNELTNIRILFDDFTYQGDVNATLKAECY